MIIMTGNVDPGIRKPEIDLGKFGRQVAREVFAYDNVIGTYPMYSYVLSLEGWEQLVSKSGIDFASAFQRARTVLQSISYQDRYWQLAYGLGEEADPSVFEDQHPAIMMGADRLLQLIVLSRVNLSRVEGNWQLPRIEDIQEVKASMRDELGLTERYKETLEEENAKEKGNSLFDRLPDFPGLTYQQIIEALASGQLSIGNTHPHQQRCWIEGRD